MVACGLYNILSLEGVNDFEKHLPESVSHSNQ